LFGSTLRKVAFNTRLLLTCLCRY